jgi:hypothetical protein
MPPRVSKLLDTPVALEKLGARGISKAEALQLLHNKNLPARNPRRAPNGRRRILLFGLTDGGRPLTLVLEETPDPTSWLIVTGWVANRGERAILD